MVFVTKAIETLTPNYSSDAIVLTGMRESRRYLVLVNSNQVLLTASCLLALLDLIHARICTYSGYSEVPSCVGPPEVKRLIIHRLRRMVSLGTSDAKAGMRLISNDGDASYRFNVNPDNIGIDPSFFELRTPFFLSSEVRDALLREAQMKRG